MRYQPKLGVQKYCGVLLFAACMCIPYIGYLALVAAMAAGYYLLYFSNQLDEKLRRPGTRR